MTRASAESASLRILLSLLACSVAASGRNLKGEIRTFVQDRGYPFEEHPSFTGDGVSLQLFRLPRPGAPTVFLQHGILDSSWAWVFNKEFKALGYQLHDAGYDVWMGNNRGTGFSLSWANGSDASDSLQFWNFTFDDMARQDVPAMINTVLVATGMKQLTFIGHSQGTTQFLIAASDPHLRSWVAERVSAFVALSPVAWLGHSGSLVLRTLAKSGVQKLVWPLFRRSFLGCGWREAAHLLCKVTLGLVCKLGIGEICGSSDLDHSGNIVKYSDYFPFGTSFKDIAHFGQAMSKDTFARFDYGAAGNMKVYGQPVEPVYNLSDLVVPTAFFIGEHDFLADQTDVARLLLDVPSKMVLYQRVYKSFSHITWSLGAEQAGYYVSDVLRVLKGTQTASSTVSRRLLLRQPPATYV